MATINQLVETILENIDGTKLGDLGLRARLLREAGYLPTGKRGGGPVGRVYRRKKLGDLNARDAAYEDVFWALLNSSEFFFIH